jgi:uncharacterized YigZ family protein
MMECTKSGSAEYVELKSHFIAYCHGVSNTSSFQLGLDQLRAQHPEASHFVYAYRLSHSQQLYEKFTDDGEPYGTAGLPLLSLLQKKGIINTALYVVRYYGGIKLGKKGLFSAYLNTAVSAIADASFKEKRRGYLLTMSFAYPVFSLLEKWLNEHDTLILERDFAQDIRLKLWMEEKAYQLFSDTEFKSLCALTGMEKMNML